jgi:anti-anti-sigma factor
MQWLKVKERRAPQVRRAVEGNVSQARGSSRADSHVGVAQGARRPGSARNRDGRPVMAPHEIDQFLPGPSRFRPGPSLSARSQDGYIVVTISGELDIASAPVLREQLLGLVRPGASRIVIDLSGVTFCDASGLAVLVGASRRADLLHGVLRLAGPAPLTATILRLTGLDSRFEIFATVPEAIAAPSHPGSREAGVPEPRAS